MLQAEGEVLVFTDAAHVARGGALRSAGAEVIGAPQGDDGHMSLEHVLRELGRRQCNDVLIEAGPTLAGAVLQLGLADELIVYLAPVMLGPDARAMAGLPPLQRLEDARRYALKGSEHIGPDVKLSFVPAAAP
jgi:diaminohydroxyphosphoribosylaminopyrimidine deaminase/5-amino-6-(5-phosphoribosylamino)uracil reductase